MWAVLAGIAAACGLVKLAAGRPSRTESRQRRYLGYLLSRLEEGGLTRDQAADGAVLSRKFRIGDAERKFRAAEATLRGPRV